MSACMKNFYCTLSGALAVCCFHCVVCMCILNFTHVLSALKANTQAAEKLECNLSKLEELCASMCAIVCVCVCVLILSCTSMEEHCIYVWQWHKVHLHGNYLRLDGVTCWNDALKVILWVFVFNCKTPHNRRRKHFKKRYILQMADC